MKQFPPNTQLEGQVNVWCDVDASPRTLGLLPSPLMPCLMCSEKESSAPFWDPQTRGALDGSVLFLPWRPYARVRQRGRARLRVLFLRFWIYSQEAECPLTTRFPDSVCSFPLSCDTVHTPSPSFFLSHWSESFDIQLKVILLKCSFQP